MYFPFLRGRQYEMLALKDLVENNKLSSKIVPVIEPIKFSPTFFNVLKKFVELKKRIAIVINPLVGDFEKELFELDDNKINEYNLLLREKCILFAYWINNELKNVDETKELIYLCNDRDNYNDYTRLLNKKKPVFTLIPDDRTLRRSIDNRVIFEDCFLKQERNSDYEKKPDEFFSDNHLYYEADGYSGFADYSTVGDEFKESGFAPMAVVIHLTYFDEKHALRLHHFVSNSNYDINDPAGKFKEALDKFIAFVDNNENFKMYNFETVAIANLRDCNVNSKYPGLGTIKKYSIMNHLEQISYFLENEK